MIVVVVVVVVAWSKLYLCSSERLCLKGWRRIHRRLDCLAWNLEAATCKVGERLAVHTSLDQKAIGTREMLLGQSSSNPRIALPGGGGGVSDPCK